MIGITTYIFEVLQRGQKQHLPPARQRVSAETGLAIGRFTDHLIHRNISSNTPIDPSNFRHKRARMILTALKRSGVKFEKTQVPVSLNGIKTCLDGLGFIGDTPVVIEIKTTQHKLKDFRERYKQRCKKRPLLTNGMPNSIESVYSLQAAFGAIAWKKAETAPRCGALVVVGASDAAQVFHIDLSVQRESHFSAPVTVLRGRTSDCVFQKLPIGPGLTLLEHAMKRHGIQDIKKGGPCSGIGRLGKTTVIIGITGTVSEKRRLRLARGIKQAALEHRKEGQTTMAVIAFTTKASKGFTVKKVLSPCLEQA